MKMTINTDVLRKYNLSFGQFIVLLTSYYSLDCQKIHDDLVERGLAERDLFKGFPPVLSDNTKNLIARIIVESDERIVDCGIGDFEALAQKLQELYPEGNKSGTTYLWRGTTEEIAQKLRTLIVQHNFTYTESEAIMAVKEYVSSFKDYKYMQLLKYFILKTSNDGQGHSEMDSLFMSAIEHCREQQ